MYHYFCASLFGFSCSEEAASYDSSRAPYVVRIITCVSHGSNITAPRRRFRVKARIRSSSRVSLSASFIARFLCPRGGGSARKHAYHRLRVSWLENYCPEGAVPYDRSRVSQLVCIISCVCHGSKMFAPRRQSRMMDRDYRGSRVPFLACCIARILFPRRGCFVR